MRPSEAYLTEYLTGPDLNLDQDEVYQKVYPVWSYSYFALLIPVFLLTDLLRYKPVIMFEGVAYVLTWVLILWGTVSKLLQLKIHVLHTFELSRIDHPSDAGHAVRLRGSHVH